MRMTSHESDLELAFSADLASSIQYWVGNTDRHTWLRYTHVYSKVEGSRATLANTLCFLLVS